MVPATEILLLCSIVASTSVLDAPTIPPWVSAVASSIMLMRSAVIRLISASVLLIPMVFRLEPVPTVISLFKLISSSLTAKVPATTPADFTTISLSIRAPGLPVDSS